MLIKDQYDMITPEKEYSLLEYETFYDSIGQIFKMSLIENQLFHEVKSSLPAYFLEISQNSYMEDKEIDSDLMILGLEKVKGKREEILRDISDTNYIQKYFNSDLEKYIDFYTNYQQFILIFANFEGTIHSFLGKKGCNEVSQSNLIENILNSNTNFIIKFNELTRNDFEKNDFENYWKYYKAIRNLYAHRFAIVDDKFIKNIDKIKTYLEDVNSKLHIEKSILKTEDFFQLKEIQLNKVFAISDSNMRLYREFLINLWETLYCLENPTFKGIYGKKVKFVSNVYNFTVYSNGKQLSSMQTLPDTLTEHLYHFKASCYMCPICKRNDFFLFTAKFELQDLDSFFNFESQIDKGKKIIHKSNIVYTCPFCKSLFFPEYQKRLTDNKGFNLLNLSARMYLNALGMIQEISKE